MSGAAGRPAGRTARAADAEQEEPSPLCLRALRPAGRPDSGWLACLLAAQWQAPRMQSKLTYLLTYCLTD